MGSPDPQAPERGRKRTKSEEQWKRNVAKRKRNLGEEYFSLLGVKVTNWYLLFSRTLGRLAWGGIMRPEGRGGSRRAVCY